MKVRTPVNMVAMNFKFRTRDLLRHDITHFEFALKPI